MDESYFAISMPPVSVEQSLRKYPAVVVGASVIVLVAGVMVDSWPWQRVQSQRKTKRGLTRRSILKLAQIILCCRWRFV